MLKILTLLLFSFSAHSALSTGTGADGACTQATIQDADSGPYHCTTLTTTALANITGTNNLTVYVQGNVIISHQINLFGGPGAIGPNDDSLAAGGIATAGGADGGSIQVSADINGTSGSGNAGGSFGRGGYLEIGDNIAAGGGGGGGGHIFSGKNGGNGDFIASDPGSIMGRGGLGGDPVINASHLIDLIPNVPGGSGGGAGGAGVENGGGNLASGGGGGAGGGSITIIAGGSITIEASGQINASGGSGGIGYTVNAPAGANAPGGAGGSGSGGTIFLYSKNTIINNGTLLATGGATVSATTDSSTNYSGGAGGAGSPGVIRLDDFDAKIEGSGSSNPAAYVFSSKPLFESQEIGFYCGQVEPPSSSFPSGPLSFLVAFIPLLLLARGNSSLNRHKEKIVSK